MKQNGMGKKLLSLMLMWTLVIGLMPGMSLTVPVKAEEPASIPEDNPEKTENGTGTPAPDTLTEVTEKEGENQIQPGQSQETPEAEGTNGNDKDPAPDRDPAVDENAQPGKNTEPVNNGKIETDIPAEQDSKDGDEPEKNEETPVPSAPTATPVKDEYPAFDSYKDVDGVRVTVTAEEGTFPEGTTLSVEKVKVEKVDAAVEEKRSEDVNVAASYTFDIKLLDKEGNEIQPAERKTVNVSFALAEVADPNLSTEVYHLSEDGNEYKAESLEVTEEGTEATVETEGFSYYTVEFTYNNLQYVLNGDESIPLSTILDTVGLKGEVKAAEVSNSDLFTVSNETGEWIVTALQAFTSTEWMKVTINGVVYEIVVTDDAETSLVGTVIKIGDTLTLNYDYIECVPNIPLNVSGSYKLINIEKRNNGWGFQFENKDVFLVGDPEAPEPSGFYVASGDGKEATTPYKLALYYEYPLWVGGVQVTSANADDVLKGTPNEGKVSFTPATDSTPATLTLNGATINSGYEYESPRKAGIYYTGSSPLNIAVEGSISLINETNPLTDGIKSDSAGKVTISGSGSLAISVSNCGLSSSGALTINGGSITATATADASSGIAAQTVEITSDYVKAIGGHAGIIAKNVIIKGGKIETQSTSPGSLTEPTAGIFVDNVVEISGGTIKSESDVFGIRAAEGVMINGGTITVNAPYGIAALQNDVKISNGEIFINANGEEQAAAIFAMDKNIRISGGTIKATVKATGNETASFGFLAMEKVIIDGGTIEVTASAEDMAAAINSFANTIMIGKNVTSLIAKGDTGAFNGEAKVLNAIAGTGWTNTAVTAGETAIAVSAEGQTLADYKKVQFPAEQTYPLWVGGIPVTSANASNITGGDTVTASYDIGTNTLTLNGATITEGYAYQEGNKAGIYYKGIEPLKIYLTGDNSVGTYNIADGIKAFNVLGESPVVTISGTGSLTVKGSNCGLSSSGSLTIDGGNILAEGTNGIIAGEDLTINGGEITALGELKGITADDLTINDGTVQVDVGGNTAFGIEATGNLTIKDGVITVSAFSGDGQSTGIAAESATITGGNINVTAKTYSTYSTCIGFDSEYITIGDAVTTFIASGETNAIKGEVKNSIAGTGWTNKEGTEGEAPIVVSTAGQTLADYKMVMFPAGKAYFLWVDGKRVTSINASDILGNKTAIYDAGSNTLTLNDATITVLDVTSGSYGICYKGSELLNIVLRGENKIENADYDDAINIGSGDVHIFGPGSLTIVAGSDSNGIRSNGSLIIEDATVNSSGRNGILSREDITITDSTVTATGLKHWQSGGIWTTGNLSITNSNVTVFEEGGSSNYGIYASYFITIKDGSTVTAVASGSDSAGIISWNYSISIEDSTVVVKASGENSAGICARNNRNITISSGIVSASGSDKAFNGNVKNSITGTGWTETGSKIIGINTAGQSLTYKKVQFPEAAIKPIEGNGFVWHKGSSDSSTIRFSSETDSDLAGVDSLTGVSVDGKDLTEGTHYETAPGSVYVTFTKSYLETLGVGAHRVVATFSTYSGDVNATFTVAAKSSGGGTTPKKDNVVTCQMAGFPANYAWNEAAKACQPGYIDAGGNFHSYNNAKHSSVPNTSDNGNLTMYVIAMFLMTFVAYITAKKLTEDSRA